MNAMRGHCATGYIGGTRLSNRLSADLVAARQEAERFRSEAHDRLRGRGEAIKAVFA